MTIVLRVTDNKKHNITFYNRVNDQMSDAIFLFFFIFVFKQRDIIKNSNYVSIYELIQLY